LQNAFFEASVAFGLDAQQVGSVLKADLIAIVATDDFSSETGTDVRTLG
jgi:hypothetical protein